ncbi:MAG TPA: PKD domain-containing protein [Thermoplasmatales archaeon]|nr:PKD domain-containing protein [Thermoplasmatales archaeon]
MQILVITLEAKIWGQKKLRMLLLIAISLVIAGFVVAEIESGFNIERAEAQSVGRNILYVGGSGPNNYTLIQDAIDNASDGDTVFVYSGIYYENVVTDKRISLIGEDKETTIIDGSNAGDVVNITADWISMSGFTIRNSGGYWPNAGVKIYRASNNTIYNCNISNNYYGISLHDSSNNTIYNCNISNNYYGISLHDSSNNTIYNCNISNNVFGIWLWYSSNNTIYNCNIINDGEGIWLWYSSNNTIYNCNIINDGEGIWLWYSSNNTIYNCNIINNEYSIRLWYSSNNTIYNCNIINNVILLTFYSSSNNIWHSPCFITYTYNGSTYTNYLGNYWSEYNGSDTNGDGIGDFVYYVGGSNYDYYPLMQPYENYDVTNFLPVANFSYLPLNPITILPIYFTDLSYDLDGSIVSWYWDFGDGTTSYKQNPKHQYNKEGLYKVNLTVEDDDSAMTTISKNIAVIKPSSDYILVTFETKNEILDSNISTNFSFIAYASAFNYTYGFIEFVDANWSIINYASNASINASHGKSILFSSGWNGGTAILYAEYDGHTDSVVFNINPSLFSFILYKGWNLITLPCENGYNASSLFNDIEGCSIILGWNASIGEFELYAPGIPYDFEIEDGHGYFIGMKNDSIFSLADIPIYNVSIPLYIGWNTLGWFKENETTASSLLENLNLPVSRLKRDIGFANISL